MYKQINTKTMSASHIRVSQHSSVTARSSLPAPLMYKNGKDVCSHDVISSQPSGRRRCFIMM